MQLDVRLPMGLMFLIIGVVLFLYGLVTWGKPMYDVSLGFNVNFWWGLFLSLFGGLMLLLARRAQQRAPKQG